MFSYQVHPYGGGHCCLNLCSHILDEGVFILPMDNHLSPSRGHQEWVILFFIYVQDDLQPWEEKAACCGQRLGKHPLVVAYLSHCIGSLKTKTQAFPSSERWAGVRLEAPRREELHMTCSLLCPQGLSQNTVSKTLLATVLLSIRELLCCPRHDSLCDALSWEFC